MGVGHILPVGMALRLPPLGYLGHVPDYRHGSVLLGHKCCETSSVKFCFISFGGRLIRRLGVPTRGHRGQCTLIAR